MGARASVSFKNGNEESIAVFSHWGGDHFLNQAKDYAEELKKDIAAGKVPASWPLGRLEPRTVCVDFLRHITKNEERIISDLYLGKNSNDGDNSDYGHETIDLTGAVPETHD